MNRHLSTLELPPRSATLTEIWVAGGTSGALHETPNATRLNRFKSTLLYLLVALCTSNAIPAHTRKQVICLWITPKYVYRAATKNEVPPATQHLTAGDPR